MAALTEIEIDALSVLEEEFVQKHRHYPAYLMRKVLNLLAPDWVDKHPVYKHLIMEAEG
ncbi:unnamed protein product [marine sediment metagenome]|uniref:Uncharacterized protein n=1 Tax=marine sediment metagenome TaxID=412755 RepID=X1NB40_9ZZZZ